MPQRPVIGLIAGSGDLPLYFAHQAKKEGFSLKTVAIRSEASGRLNALSDEITWVSAGQLGSLLTFFKKHNVPRAVMHGKVQHAGNFRHLHLDWKAFSLWRTLKDRSGESLLKGLAAELSKGGTKLLDGRFLMQGLLPKKGWLTRPADPAVQLSIHYGLQRARVLARLGIGQALAVKKSAVVAVEAMEGTDETIRRAVKVGGKGAVLIKVSSPRQDWRFDIPTLGLKTIQQLVRAKARGLVLESGRAFLLSREKVLELAEKEGIFILAV